MLVERHQRDVYRLCYRYVGNHEDANDLAQEAFLKAWRGIGSFRGESAFSTWLYRIAVNACLNHRALQAAADAGAARGAARSRAGRQAEAERDDERAARARGGEPAAREAAGDADPEGLPRPDARGGGRDPRLDRGHREGEPVPRAREPARSSWRRREMTMVMRHLTDESVARARRRARAGARDLDARGRVRGLRAPRGGAATRWRSLRRADVPEPSPLYWESLAPQVAQRIADGAAARRSGAGAGSLPLAGAPRRLVAFVLWSGRPAEPPARRSRLRCRPGRPLPRAEEDEGLDVLGAWRCRATDLRTGDECRGARRRASRT